MSARAVASRTADRRRRIGPVELVDLLGDQHRQRDLARAAHHGRRDVEAERQHEHQQHARGDARHGERQDDLPEGPQGRGAQPRRGARQRRVDLPERIGDRQDHVGQQDVDHRDLRGERRVEDAQWPLDQAGGEQGLVDQPMPSHQHHPGVAPHQNAGPEGQQDQDQDDRRPAPRAHQGERHRVAQQQRSQGDDHGGVERVPEDLEEYRVIRQCRVVRQLHTGSETLRISIVTTGRA